MEVGPGPPCEECHQRGVIHLDLKPSVIWEVAQPSSVIVKILDFGLARITNPSTLSADAQKFFEGPANGLIGHNPPRLQALPPSSVRRRQGLRLLMARRADSACRKLQD